MSYSCLEELQVDLDLHALDKTDVLFNAGCKYDNGWLVVTDDGICHFFDKDGNPDDITEIMQLKENHIRKDITKIVIPDSVTSIGDYAFYYCSALISVTIGSGVSNIGSSAFYGCGELTSIMIPNSVKSIGNNAFDHSALMSVTIPNGVTSIGDQTFYRCSGLMSVEIGNGVTNIGAYAFSYCSGLTSVMIPDSVTSIGGGAFEGCYKLTNLIFKDKTLEQVKKMWFYPWGIEDKSIIQVG